MSSLAVCIIFSAGHLKGMHQSREPHSNLRVIGLCAWADYQNRNVPSQSRWWESGVRGSAGIFISKYVNNRDAKISSKVPPHWSSECLVWPWIIKIILLVILTITSNQYIIFDLNWSPNEVFWLILHTKGSIILSKCSSFLHLLDWQLHDSNRH